MTREEAIEYLERADITVYKEPKTKTAEALEMAIEALKERKVGHWVAVDSYDAFGGDEATWSAHGNPTAFYYCSECRKQSMLDEFGNDILSKYCMFCGAKMKGEQT